MLWPPPLYAKHRFMLLSAERMNQANSRNLRVVNHTSANRTVSGTQECWRGQRSNGSESNSVLLNLLEWGLSFTSHTSVNLCVVCGSSSLRQCQHLPLFFYVIIFYFWDFFALISTGQ